MEWVYNVLDILKLLLPYALLLFPIAAIGLIRMLIYKKYKQFVVCLVFLSIFLVNRYLETQVLPLNSELFWQYINIKSHPYSLLDIICIYGFVILGWIYLNKKACPKCKSIDSVKKIGEKLIGEEVINEKTQNIPHAAGLKSITTATLRQTYENIYVCEKCGYQWSETEKRDKNIKSESDVIM